jgi:hypothetical protein
MDYSRLRKGGLDVWSDAPDTPAFDDALIEMLRQDASTPRRRLPARLGALRSLRSLNHMGLHAALACGLAATLLLLSPNDGTNRQLPMMADPEQTPTPAYLYQYGATGIEQTVEAARARGYEVQVLRSYVTDVSDHQRILSIRHAGTDLDAWTNEDVRGPLLIVIGLVAGDVRNPAD